MEKKGLQLQNIVNWHMLPEIKATPLDVTLAIIAIFTGYCYVKNAY